MNPNPYTDGAAVAGGGSETWLRPWLVSALAPASVRDVVIPAGVPTQILVRNPRRVGLTVVTGVSIAGDTFLGPWSDPQTYGVPIGTTGRVASFQVDDLLSLIGETWYAYNAGGGTVRVVEFGRQG